jgi:Ergosterol biosynthesis ERG4/ERG24 family
MAGVSSEFSQTPPPSWTDSWIDGYARKVHYTCDFFFASSWGLITGFQSPFPWFYPVFFTAMIIHRAIRDIQRCRTKYGKAWEEYERQVPYLFIPVSNACILSANLALIRFLVHFLIFAFQAQRHVSIIPSSANVHTLQLQRLENFTRRLILIPLFQEVLSTSTRACGISWLPLPAMHFLEVLSSFTHPTLIVSFVTIQVIHPGARGHYLC